MKLCKYFTYASLYTVSLFRVLVPS